MEEQIITWLVRGVGLIALGVASKWAVQAYRWLRDLHEWHDVRDEQGRLRWQCRASDTEKALQVLIKSQAELNTSVAVLSAHIDSMSNVQNQLLNRQFDLARGKE